MAKSKALYHGLALFTVLVWATTFVSSKTLIVHGIPPAEIFFVRFLLAYICIIPFARKGLWCRSVSHELLMLVLGVTGGTAYFLFENTALKFTAAGNVCLLVSSTPLFTAIISLWLAKGERLTMRLVIGSLLAFAGVALVVVNDWSHMQIRLRGDVLALMAALMWAFYQILVKRAFAHYSIIFVTRKIFGYGVLSILLYFMFAPPTVEYSAFLQPVVIGNLLFLGIIASCLCFFTWNVVIEHVGSVVSSNYLYLQPLIAAAASAVILDEPITWAMAGGMVLIVTGVYLAETRKRAG